jgi:hypothetical protein
MQFVSRKDLNVAGFFAFSANAAVKGHTLVFGKALKAGRLNVLKVGEQIGATCIWRNKAKAFCVIEPLYNTCLISHFYSFFVKNRQHAYEALETKI